MAERTVTLRHAPSRGALHHASHRWLDKLGVYASVGCAVHCCVAPLVVLLAPLLGGIWVHPGTHLAIAALVLPVAYFSLIRGAAAGGRRWVRPVGSLGLALVLIGTLWPFVAGSPVSAAGACQDCCPTVHLDAGTGAWSLQVPPATVVTMLGGALLVLAHVARLRCAGPSCSAGGVLQSAD